MSLYNMVAGVEPTAALTLRILGLQPIAIKRFRDAFFDWSDREDRTPVLVVRTRTGGDYRRDYEAEHAALRAVAGYLEDRDDGFDPTFADFFYAVPTEHHDAVSAYLKANGKPLSLKAKIDAAVATMTEHAAKAESTTKKHRPRR